LYAGAMKSDFRFRFLLVGTLGAMVVAVILLMIMTK
jgi:hypothetical protein